MPGILVPFTWKEKKIELLKKRGVVPSNEIKDPSHEDLERARHSRDGQKASCLSSQSRSYSSCEMLSAVLQQRFKQAPRVFKRLNGSNLR